MFGVVLFSDGKGGGLHRVIVRPEAGTLRVGTAEAQFAVADYLRVTPVELPDLYRPLSRGSVFQRSYGAGGGGSRTRNGRGLDTHSAMALDNLRVR